MAEANAVSTVGTEERTDEVLLERYTARREEAAFAALVRRHSPVVLGVCRQVLQHEQDAEDAFQAVFCVLARKAGTIRPGIALGGWLYAVAGRIARKAKALQVRRRMRERELPDVPAPDLPPEVLWRDLGAVLVEEVSRLPERYRQPFVLCELEGKSNQEAATELRCPVGTGCSRLARARERLRVRLTRRGLALSAGALAAALASESSAAAIRTGLADIATETAIRCVIGQPVAIEIVTLADAFLRAVLRAKLLVAAGLLSGLAIIVSLVVWLWFHPGAGQGPAAPTMMAPSKQADQERLQGSWRVVVRQKGGLPPEFPDLVYIFAGDHVTLSFGGLQGPAFPFALDVSQNPSAIDFTLPIGKVPHGIYQLDEDSWKLCLDMNPDGPSKRPASMQPPPDAPYVCLFAFRRERTPQCRRPSSVPGLCFFSGDELMFLAALLPSLFRLPGPADSLRRRQSRRRLRLCLEWLEDRSLLSVFTVIDLGDTGMGSGFYGDLRYCLNQANVNSEPNNTVVFDPSLAGTITLIQGPLPISKALEIDGPGQDVVTISGNHQSGVLNITGDSDTPMITISGLTIADGIGVQGAGGGVFSDHATLSLSNCTVTGNSVPISGSGGGIYLNRGTLTVNSCTVSANVSGGDGGGIYNSGGTLIVNDSRVSDNTSGRTGGGIYSRQFFPFPDDTTFVLNSSVIAGNHAGNAAFDVGGLDISDAATITDSTISGNTGYQAGGICLLGTLARQTISIISGCAIVGNTASTLGAGIVNDGDSLTITRTVVSGNTSVREATGGIYNGGAGRLTLSDSIISENVGGGMRNFSQLTISGSTISGNTLGGGLVTFFDTTRVDNSTFSGNSSNAGGGILVMPNAFAELTSVTITDNTANGPGRFDGGGGLSVLSTYGNGRALLRNALVAGNFCAYAGPDVLGSVLSLGYNLVGAADDSEGWGATDLTGTSGSPIDPRLGPLQDNGGPTPTHALLVGSPAINHGDPALIDSLDQRGSVRFHTGINPPVDIGAFDANFLQSFRLIAPSEVAAGESFTITVTALDYSGNTASTFVGRVHFSSTDPDAALPDDYTFTAADAGTATFTVTLQTAGSQRLQVTALGPEGFYGNTTVIVDPAGDEANEPQAWASSVVNEAPRWSPSMPSPTPSLRGVFTAPTTPAVRAEIICPSHLHRRAPAVTRDMAAPIDLSPRTSEPDDCA